MSSKNGERRAESRKPEQPAGWYDFRFSRVLEILTRQQRPGHVGEIGVYCGQSLEALCRVLRPGELAVGVDCFEDQAANVSGSGVGASLAASTAATAGYPVRWLIGNSRHFTRLNYRNALDTTETPYRLWHVDGGHDVDTCLHDLTETAATLAEDGMLIVDDVFNPQWPTVSEAFYAWLDSVRQFGQPCDWRPIFCGYGKVCLAQRKFADLPGVLVNWLNNPCRVIREW